MHKPTFKEESEFIKFIIYENHRDINAKFNPVWISAGGKLFATFNYLPRQLMKIALYKICCIVVMGQD